MKNTPPAVPAGPAITEPAPAGATANAAAEPDDAWYARLGRRLFGGEQAADQAPAATATAPAEPTSDPRVDALVAKVAELEARAADAEAEAVRAQVRACGGLPADAVDPVADLVAACPDPEKRTAALAALAAIKPPRLDAAAFADLAPMGYAGGSANLGTGPHATNPAQAAAVAAAEAEFKDDPAGLMAALERIHAEGV